MNKNTHKISFYKTTKLLHLPRTTLTTHLNHLYTIGTIRNYDPVKQYYIFASYHDPTRSLFVPQKALPLNDDFLLPIHDQTSASNFFPKMKNVIATPLDDNYRSPYTLGVQKHYSFAQINFIIAKFSPSHHQISQ